MIKWGEVAGYEGRYEVSDTGLVRSLDFTDSLGRLRRGCVLKHQLDHRGYARVRLSLNDKKKSYRIHRLVAMAFLPNIEGKRTVNHKDGNKENNISSNLEWATDSEQLIHAYSMGLVVAKKAKEAGRFISPVEVLDMSGNYLYSVNGNIEMAERGFDYQLVSAVTLGKRKSHRGHKFRRIII